MSKRDKSAETPHLRCKVDPLDLGQVLAWIEGAWVRLAGPDHMVGVDMTSWVDTCARLKAKHGAQAALHYDIVAKALRRLREMGTTARLKANVEDMSLDSDAITKAANGIRIHFVERAKAQVEGKLLATDSGSAEASFMTSGTEGNHIDLDFQEAVAISPPEDERAFPRPNTELGLDDGDIDLDGDVLEDDPVDDNEVDLDFDTAEQPLEPVIEPPPLPASPNNATSSFLPQPKRRTQT